MSGNPYWRYGRWTIAAFALAAGLFIALVAVVNSDRTASCVNNTLGDRQGLTKADNKAHVQLADAFNDLLTISATDSPAAQQAAIAKIRSEVLSAKNTLEQDEVAREKKPLGKC